MIANPDGSIILTTSVDTSGITKAASNLELSYKKAVAAAAKEEKKLIDLQNQLAQATETGAEAPIKMQKEYEKLQEKIKNIKEEIRALDAQQDELMLHAAPVPEGGVMLGQADQSTYDANLQKIQQLEEQLEKDKTKADELSASMASIADESKQAQVQKLNDKISEQSQKLEFAKEKAQLAGQKLEEASQKPQTSAEKSTESLKDIGKSFEKFGNRIAGLIKRVFIFSVITMGLRQLRSLLSDILKNNNDFQSSMNNLKAAFYIAFIPLINAITPIIKTFVDWITIAIISITELTAALFNIPYDNLIKQAKEYTKAQEKSEESTKGQTAAFDELNQISKSDKKTENALLKSFANLKKSTSPLKKISRELATFMKVLGVYLAALGVILIFLGHPIFGVGALIAGLAFWSIGAKSISDKDPTQTMAKQLQDFQGVVGSALLAIGIILLFLGHPGFGIAAIIGGLLLIGKQAKDIMEDSTPKEAEAKLNDLATTISLTLAAVGLILMLLGQLGWGLAALIGGLAAYEITDKVSPTKGELSKTIDDFITKHADTILLVANVMIILGIMLLLVPHMVPVGVGLIATGAIGKWKAEELSTSGMDSEVEKIKDYVSNVLLATGAVLVFIGLLLCLVPGARLLGVKLLIMGLTALFGGAALGSDTDPEIEISGDVQVKHKQLREIAIANPGEDPRRLVRNIPRYATGGIVPHATIAMLGEGNKKEAVLPLEQNTSWMDMLADRVISRMPQQQVYDNRPIVIQVDGREIARADRNGQRKLGNNTITGEYKYGY